MLCGILVWESWKHKSKWTGRPDMTEQLLKTALNSKQSNNQSIKYIWTKRMVIHGDNTFITKYMYTNVRIGLIWSINTSFDSTKTNIRIFWKLYYPSELYIIHKLDRICTTRHQPIQADINHTELSVGIYELIFTLFHMQTHFDASSTGDPFGKRDIAHNDPFLPLSQCFQ